MLRRIPRFLVLSISFSSTTSRILRRERSQLESPPLPSPPNPPLSPRTLLLLETTSSRLYLFFREGRRRSGERRRAGSNERSGIGTLQVISRVSLCRSSLSSPVLPFCLSRRAFRLISLRSARSACWTQLFHRQARFEPVEVKGHRSSSADEAS